MAETPAAPPRNGTSGRPRQRAARDWTPAQSGDVYFHEALELVEHNCKVTGRPLTVEKVRAEHPDRLTTEQVRATFRWAVASGYATWAEDGESVHPG